MKKYILLIISILYINIQISAQEKRLDSFSVKSYEINLDLSNLGTQEVAGTTGVIFATKVNDIKNITLDLAPTLNVTSVTIAPVGNAQTPTTYIHSGDKLFITTNLNNTSDYEVRVTYSGKPEKDPSGWGGFYFTGSYAFNLGVGFQSNPHNYGRAWFPCVDEFPSRALYNFNIITADDNKAFCNGLLKNNIDNMDGTVTWSWEMTDPIPTYLASVAVAPYATIKSSYNGLNNIIPIELAALPADTNNVKASFENLSGAIAAFEAAYGAHTFSRVGFNMVPFNGGAMEHATNIAYPLSAANGSKDRETLFAHELSHHWWGNTVTCRTAEDMWINEGWASYSENLFLEAIYGTDRYKEAVSNNHYDVLRWAHIRDGQARAIYGIPHEYTYGMHVYDKGADAVHTLRGYMGKDDFIEAAKAFLTLFKFMDVSSEDLRDEFQKHTSADLTAFFDNWIFTEGFPHFELINMETSQNGSEYQNEITIEQKMRFTSKVYTNVPLEVTFFDADQNQYTETVIINTYYHKFTINTPFSPVYAAIDYDEKISDAITDKYLNITNTGAYNFENALMNINVSSLPSPAFIRVEHHWVGPNADNNNVEGLYLSNSRYWSVDGIIPDGFEAKATIIYDGRTPANNSAGYLDHNHIKSTEDSLVLMYRPTKLAEWTIYDDYTKNTGSTSDAFGSMIINNLKKGDYCFAMYDYTLNTKSPIKKTDYLKVYPNPSDGFMNFKVSNIYTNSNIVIVDSKGTVVDTLMLHANENIIGLDTSNYSNGIYFASLMVNNTSFERVKFIVKH